MPKKPSRFEELRTALLRLMDLSTFRSESELSRLHKFLHFWALVGRSFVRNRCPIRASALSYTTLIALIPVLAVAMSLSSLFLKSKGEEQIETFIGEVINRMVPVHRLTAQVQPNTSTNAVATNSAPADTNAEASAQSGQGPETNSPSIASPPNESGGTSPEVLADQRLIHAQKSVARYIHQFIQNTYSGTLGVTGMIFLVITAILTLSRIEDAFNDIWGVTRGRDWMVRVVNYFTTILGGPILLVGALGLAGEHYFVRTRAMISGLPLVEPVMSRVLPWVVVCLAFALFYKLVPNTKVHLGAALVGGTLAGTLWHIYNLLGFLFVSRAVSASKIYGSLALVPLFMGGLYIVWLTVLFGAQVAYAFQNRSHYLQDKLAENVNQRGREFIALRLMTCVGRNFQLGMPPADVSEISSELGIPSRLVQQVLHTLLAARLVVEVAGREMAYAPARPLETITAHHVLLAMRTALGQDAVARDEPLREEVYGEYARIQEAEKAAASAVTLRSLVDRAQARLQIPAGEVAKKDAA